MEFDKFGFDKDGYNREGFNRWGFDRNGYNKDGYDMHGYDINGFNKVTGRDKNGYDIEGYDLEGYTRDGYNREGFNREGYDREGFNKDGYNDEGYNRDGYDIHGYDKLGYDADGYNERGFNRKGRDRLGYDENGYDCWGYNKEGYNSKGFNLYGYDYEGYDIEGYDIEGFNREGIHKLGFYKSDFDEHGYHIIMGFNLEGYDKDGFNINGYNQQGYDKEGYDSEGRNVNGYDRDGYDAKGYDAEGYHYDGFNDKGYNRQGYDKYGYNKEGYDIEGYNREGYDKDGYDRAGMNRKGETKTNLKHRELNIGLKPSDLKIGRIVYHPKLGEGEIIQVQGDTLLIDFDKGEYMFSRESAFKKFSLVSFDKLDAQEKSYDEIEDEKERKYFKSTTDYILQQGLGASKFRTENIGTSHIISGIDADGFYTTKTVYLDGPAWRHLASTPYADNVYLAEPYFCHIAYNKDDALYIGKRSIGDKVIDWADKRASLYYQYQMYLNNDEYGLELVRDIDINKGVYTGYRDKYNRHAKKGELIDNELLTKIIKANQKSKSVHDIIRTIQNNQYNIVVYDADKSCVVLGCAGSGKTMILLHKIRYMSYNVKNLNLEDVIVISPTNVLERESKELSKILGISKVQQYTMAEFYVKTFLEIIEEKGVYCKKKIEIDFLQDKTENYSSNYLSSKYDMVCKILNEKTEKEKFASVEREMIYKKQTEYNHNFIDERIKKVCRSKFSIIKKEFAEYSVKAIEVLLKEIDKKIEKEASLEKEKQIIELLKTNHCYINKKIGEVKVNSSSYSALYYTNKVFENIELEMLEELITTHKCSDKSTLLQMISIAMGNRLDKGLIQSVKREWNSFEEKDVERLWKNITKELDNIKEYAFASEQIRYMLNQGYYHGNHNVRIPLEYIKKSEALKVLKQTGCKVEEHDIIHDLYQLEYLEDKLERLHDFVLGKKESYIFDVIERVILEQDNQNDNVDLIKVSSGKIFAALWILRKIYMYEHMHKRYFFIDEFQDFAPTEIEFLKQLYLSAVFNYYGDYFQCINEKGLRTKEEVDNATGVKKVFYISENYRNPCQVTRYVKKRFPYIDMLEIGLDGHVNCLDEPRLSDLQRGDRAAVIISDESDVNEVRERLLELSPNVKLNDFVDSGYIMRDTYNIVPISMAKGLEFEVVILFEENLNDNQVYVGCTRSLRELQIVSTENRHL